MNHMNNYVSLVNRPLPKNNPKFPSISLFSGVLGIEQGLERAGFHTRLALDFDKDAYKAYESNKPLLGSYPFICEDINKVSPQRILKESSLKPEETAILAGGPPCQPFSKSGLRKGIQDERGSLFKRYLDYLKAIKPKSFLLENVRGMYSSRGGKDFQLILKSFEDSGYTVYWRIVDAANFGIPQFRQRLFLIGFRDRLRFNWPEETHADSDSTNLFNRYLPFVTVEDAIGDLEEMQGPRLTGRYSHLVADIPEGMNYSYYTAERNHPNPLFGWRTKFWYFLLKIDRKRPSLTIQAYPGNNTGPFHWRNRRLAIDELKRLQSLPDWLKINASYMTAHRLIGNCVPPLIAEMMGREIMQALKANQKISPSEYLALRSQQEKSGNVRSGRGSGKRNVALKECVA